MYKVIGNAAKWSKMRQQAIQDQERARVEEEAESAQKKAIQATLGWHIHPNRGQSRAVFHEFDHDSEGETDTEERRRDLEVGVDQFANIPFELHEDWLEERERFFASVLKTKQRKERAGLGAQREELMQDLSPQQAFADVLEVQGRLPMPTPLRAIKAKQGDHALSPRREREQSTVLDLTRSRVGPAAIRGLSDYIAKNDGMKLTEVRTTLAPLIRSCRTHHSSLDLAGLFGREWH